MENYKKALFLKFINDDCTPAEVEQLLKYLQNPEVDATYKDLMDEVWRKLKTHGYVDLAEKERQFEIILDRSRKESRPAKVRSLLSKSHIRMAAVFIGFLLISSLAYLLFIRSAPTIYQTGFGETRMVILPDGSEVKLNGNSKLSYRHNPDSEEAREVFLEGEAFFSVVHTRNDRKFLVRTTDDVSVEVLGTLFNVHNRHNKTEVVLNEGKVKVSINTDHEKQEVLMNPGELVAYSQTTRQYSKELINTKIYTSWKDNMLIFKEHSLQEIALVLQDNYGYHIRFANRDIGTYKFTGSIPADKVEVLFSMLVKSFDLDIERKGKNIKIVSKD